MQRETEPTTDEVHEAIKPDAILDVDGKVIWPPEPKKPWVQQDEYGISFNFEPSSKTTRRTIAGIGAVGLAAGIELQSPLLLGVSGGLVAVSAELKLVDYLLKRKIKN